MTADEYFDQYEVLRRRHRTLIYRFSPLYLVVIAVVWFGFEPWGLSPVVAVLLISFLPPLGPLIYFFAFRKWRDGPRCPACDHLLIWLSRPRVFRTRCCPYCKSQIIKSDPPVDF
jgi:hypothetical protein